MPCLLWLQRRLVRPRCGLWELGGVSRPVNGYQQESFVAGHGDGFRPATCGLALTSSIRLLSAAWAEALGMDADEQPSEPAFSISSAETAVECRLDPIGARLNHCSHGMAGDRRTICIERNARVRRNTGLAGPSCIRPGARQVSYDRKANS